MMARTVLNLDRDLLDRAKETLGQDSFTSTVTEALRRVVARQAFTEVLDDLEAMDDEQRAALAGARERW